MYKNIIILPDGTELLSGTGTKNAIKSVKLTEMVNSGTDLIIGSCCSNMIEATVFTPGGSLNITSGDTIVLYKESDGGERLKVGTFTVEAPTRPTANTMKIVGYDAITKLDKDLTAWLSAVDGWPYSVVEFAELVCRACNVDYFAPSGAPNSTFMVDKFTKNGVTGRQIMRWLGEILCRFIYADADGCVRFGWYQESGKILEPAGSNYYFAGSLSFENYSIEPINNVQIRLADSADGAAWPPADEGDNSYIITGNPILTASVTDKLIPYLDTILDELSFVDYTPCTISAPADPTVKAGSIISITDMNGKNITAYVMEKTSTGMRDTYKCTGNKRRDSSASLYNKTESEKNAEAAANAAAGITQQMIMNKLTNGGEDQGIFLKDGKVYINAEYLLAGSFSSVADVFLDPGLEEIQTIKEHVLGTFPIPVESLSKYDFNNDGDVTISDMLIAQQCALGKRTLKDWTGAVKTQVTVTIDSSNAEKTVWIYGTNMWGRAVEYYMGFAGANIGRVIGDLVVSGALTVGGSLDLTGKLFVGDGIIMDEFPEIWEEGRLVLKKVPV